MLRHPKVAKIQQFVGLERISMVWADTVSFVMVNTVLFIPMQLSDI